VAKDKCRSMGSISVVEAASHRFACVQLLINPEKTNSHTNRLANAEDTVYYVVSTLY